MAEEEARGQVSMEDTGTAEVNRLADRLGVLARQLQSERSNEATMRAVVAAAVELIPGTDEASISYVSGRRTIDTRVSSGELPARVDALQQATGQGPCLEAIYEQRTVRVPDLAQATQWPSFARRVTSETDARSTLSFQLFVESDNLGALNLVSRRPGAFTDDSEQIGLLVATHAAVAVAGAQRAEHLQAAIDSRDVIGQAKGILMERYKLSATQAFVLLTQVSQRRNTKLVFIAEELAHTGQVEGLDGQV